MPAEVCYSLLQESTTHTSCALLLLPSLVAGKVNEGGTVSPRAPLCAEGYIYIHTLCFHAQTCPLYSFSVLVNWFFSHLQFVLPCLSKRKAVAITLTFHVLMLILTFFTQIQIICVAFTVLKEKYLSWILNA